MREIQMKNLINVNAIIDYMIENKISKEKFCKLCNISTKQFEKIMWQDFDLYSIQGLVNINDFLKSNQIY